MISVRVFGAMLKNYGFVGVFSVIVLLSLLSVFANVILSFVLTAGSRTSGSLFQVLVGDESEHEMLRRSLDVNLEFSDSAVGGIQGILPGYNVVRTFDVGSNQTDSSPDEKVALVSNETGGGAGVVPEVISDQNGTAFAMTATEAAMDSNLENVNLGIPINHVTNLSANGGHPWWWVEFEVQNETFLREVDKYLLEVAEFHEFSVNVSLEDIENLRAELPPLIPNMRNPCWLELVPDDFSYDNSIYKCHINYRRIRKSYTFLTELLKKRAIEGVKWRMRCFPSFFLIGVAKCGTTDLYEAMTQHPDIITSELKEPEYWSRQRYGTNPWLFQTDCPAFKEKASFAEYMDTYDNSSEAVRRSFIHDLDGAWHSDVIFGDYSTHTMEELFFWDRSQDEPVLITADHIHKLNPSTKFIVIFRDPVERAYSRYKMRFKNRGNVAGTTNDFHERMTKQVAGTEACLKMYKRRVCVYKENIGKAGDHTILVNGMYIIYLKDWLNVFPLEQFMLIHFEDYIQDRLGHIEKIMEFLELRPLPEAEKEYIRNMPAANAGISIGGGMMNETREILQNFFRPLNQELVDLTGDSSFLWGY